MEYEDQIKLLAAALGEKAESIKRIVEHHDNPDLIEFASYLYENKKDAIFPDLDLESNLVLLGDGEEEELSVEEIAASMEVTADIARRIVALYGLEGLISGIELVKQIKPGYSVVGEHAEELMSIAEARRNSTAAQ